MILKNKSLVRETCLGNKNKIRFIFDSATRGLNDLRIINANGLRFQFFGRFLSLNTWWEKPA